MLVAYAHIEHGYTPNDNLEVYAFSSEIKAIEYTYTKAKDLLIEKLEAFKIKKSIKINEKAFCLTDPSIPRLMFQDVNEILHLSSEDILKLFDKHESFHIYSIEWEDYRELDYIFIKIDLNSIALYDSMNNTSDVHTEIYDMWKVSQVILK